METKKRQVKAKRPYAKPTLVKREKLEQITEGAMLTISGVNRRE